MKVRTFCGMAEAAVLIGWSLAAFAESLPPDGGSHNQFDPSMMREGSPLPGAGYPWERVVPIKAEKQATTSRPDGIDLDVTYISREPRYKRYDVPSFRIPQLKPGTENDKRWPDHGEAVAFTAHFKNSGTSTSPPFKYKWLIDGREVVPASFFPQMEPSVEGTSILWWNWAHMMDGERVVDDHTVQFIVDPDNLVPETCETNNSLEDRTNALSLRIVMTPEMYAKYSVPAAPALPCSAEDWLQKNIAAMNWAFANSVYDCAPDGATERVRIDSIEISSRAPHVDLAFDGGWFVNADYRHVSAFYDPATDIDWGFAHELSHQVGLIDLYASNLFDVDVRVLDREGMPANFGFMWPRGDLMEGGDIAPHTDHHLYSSHSACGISSNKGYRRGYIGEYQFDIPRENYLRVLDVRGNPAPGVRVDIYPQAGVYPNQETYINNSPVISGIADYDGIFHLPNRSVNGGITTRTGHTFRDNPFGAVSVAGDNNRFLVKLSREDHEEFDWMDITEFNLAYWSGDTESHTFTINSHIPTYGLRGPGTVSAKVEGSKATLSWSPGPPPAVSGYYVYRAAPPIYRYERVSNIVYGLSYTDVYNDKRIYAVTALDGNGEESGFSNFVWAPCLSSPTSVDIAPDGTRVILDHTVLLQRPDGRYIRNFGSPHYDLSSAEFMAMDSQERFLFNYDEAHGVGRQFVRFARGALQSIYDFGSRGSGNGQFRSPAAIAVRGDPCDWMGYSEDTTCDYRILVADSSNNRIQVLHEPVFDEYLEFLSAYGGYGQGPGQFNYPRGLAVAGLGMVIVADSGNDRLQVLSFDGTDFSFIREITGDLYSPTAVDVYGSDKIIVADTGNNAIKVFDMEGNLRSHYTLPNDGCYRGPFNQPTGVTVDRNGNIIVADTGNKRVVSILNALPPLPTPTRTPTSTPTHTPTTTPTSTPTSTPTITPTTPPLPSYIIDNTDIAGFRVTGAWTSGAASSQKYGSDYGYHAVNASSDTAQWAANVEAGVYEVYVWYPTGTNRSADAQYIVQDSRGAYSYYVNQQANGGGWRRLGTQFRCSGSTTVTLTARGSDTSRYVIADAIKLVMISRDLAPTPTPTRTNVPTPPPLPSYIIDNADAAGFKATGAWTSGAASSQKYGSDYGYHAVNASSDTAQWAANVEAGVYEVYVWYPTGTNRSADAQYIVQDSRGAYSYYVNQQANGGGWCRLGTQFRCSGGTTVTLTARGSDTSRYAIADAVKLVMVAR